MLCLLQSLLGEITYKKQNHMEKIIQIAPVHSGGQDGQSSLIHLFALCEDGKVWVQYQDFGGIANPLDTTWQPVHVNPPVEPELDTVMKEDAQ